MSLDEKIVVHIECGLKATCTIETDVIRHTLLEHLTTNVSLFKNGFLEVSSALSTYVDFARVVDLPPSIAVSFWQADLLIHVFRMTTTEPDKDYLDGEDDLPAFEQWELPNQGLDGLWDSVIAEDGVKERMLGYADTSVHFSNASIDSNIISWNRMMLLHGPPGTGKTTLCKALAQKVYIRNSVQYTSGVLLDINAHSLFSKWFSESGKLVMKLFDHVAEIAEDTESLVVILVDEVESVATSRSYSSRSNEPGDAVRVVNSVLTSLDALRRRPNVLVLCTSNMASGIDAAFLDRVDLRVFLGPPGAGGVYRILRSCIVELMRCRIISPETTLPEDMSELICNADSGSMDEENASLADGSAGSMGVGSLALLVQAVHACTGMSGRSLRKLPLRAHAYHLVGKNTSLEKFLYALLSTVRADNASPQEDEDV
jgi:hypothetical protein